ncbi:hypothetical protein R1sor_003507 [Riccia sorocarpa]|uniref:Endonuclease/exonuclease/phosphatase domain-containing protein n=1 Tax=Riccia sorocarpa TaxID=122646 RepID=A0ABD3H1S8_9MARC
MARPEFKLDTSDTAIQNTRKRLSDVQQLEPPVRRSRQVQLTPAPEHDSLKDLMTTEVVTTFYGTSPQRDQFKACIGDAWGSLENVEILQTRAMARRGMFFTRLDSHLSQLRVLSFSSPIIKGAPSVTLPYPPEMDSSKFVSPIRLTWIGADIVIEEFQKLNQGPMAIPASPSSREAVWRENTDLHHVSFLQLLNQQSLGAYEANQTEGVQPMEEEVQSSQYGEQGITFGVVSVYSPNSPSRRQQLWRNLRTYLPFRPWIIRGDMNMVELPEDVSGDSPMLKGAEKVEFQRLVAKFNLLDGRYTALEAWGPKYTHHFPVSLRLSSPDAFLLTTGSKSSYFKVDPSILSDPELLHQIQRIWREFEQRPQFQLEEYARTWSEQLKTIESFQRARDQELKLLPSLELQLAALHQSNDLSSEAVKQIEDLTRQVHKLRELQHHKWRLWSRVKYLKHGDAPTSFFLRCFKRRQARNRIRMLQLD